MSIASASINMRVPAGFRNLLEGLAREVLREQPTDVVAFAAQYFQKLLEQREAGAIDPVAWGAMLEDDRLTWPPSQVCCPPLQAPPENLRCQELHWVPAPTLSLPPLCHIV
ncbi:sperm surface protein Sp17 isoform X1 [Corvus moneduloides]|nr:sperm surface protein Sp17 isoform X1 [Corvus moneduloides]